MVSGGGLADFECIIGGGMPRVPRCEVLEFLPTSSASLVQACCECLDAECWRFCRLRAHRLWKHVASAAMLSVERFAQVCTFCSSLPVWLRSAR